MLSITEMDFRLFVFVLLLISKFYKAEANCDIQYCQKCFSSQKCSVCVFGRFGQKCEYECHAKNETCSLCRDWLYLNKDCFGCKVNENGTCIPCREGYFGTNCSETCPENCLKCDSQDLCTSCKNGWAGKICQCSENCKQQGQEDKLCDEKGVCFKGCKNGTRGHRCDLECINKEKCVSCNQLNEQCLHCSEGWYGSSCNKTCGHCQPDKEGLTKCNISTGECNDTCVDGYYGLSCDKTCGQCLPKEIKSNLKTPNKCDKISGSCLFGCKQGWFGDTCENSCSINCLNGNCNQLSGQCSDRCVSGWYGDQCKQNCSNTCANGTCDSFSSFCNEGCVSGWYGNTCNETCSNACVNMSCDQTSGYCVHGCISGWYGSTCNKTCNAACVNMSCDQDSGYCDYGCASEWYGEKCEYSCSKNCKEESCDRQTAKCSFGCKKFFKGPFCNDTENFEILLNPGFTKVIIGAAGCISLIVFVLIASLLVRKCLRRKQCCSPKKYASTDLFSVHQHIELYQDIGGNTSTPPVYEDINDIMETSFTHAYNTRSDLLPEKTQVSCSRNCTSGIYFSPWDLKWSANMTGATGSWSDSTGGKQQVDFTVTKSDDLDGDYELLSPAEDADTASKANYFDDQSGNCY